MSWEGYALGALGLAGLEVLVTSLSNTTSAPTSNITKFFTVALPGVVADFISPTVPTFGAAAATAAAVTTDAATTSTATVGTVPVVPAVLSPLMNHQLNSP